MEELENANCNCILQECLVHGGDLLIGFDNNLYPSFLGWLPVHSDVPQGAPFNFTIYIDKIHHDSTVKLFADDIALY